MERLENLVDDFLAQRSIAVVGVSDKRETGCNQAYRNFRENGYRVFAVNPRLSQFEGDPCYPDLKSIPEKPGAVFVLTNPRVTDLIVDECIALGVRHVWMHCLLGTRPGLVPGMTSVSAGAVELCRANGIAVIPGSCPNQHLRPDFGHRMMGGLWRVFGFLKMT